MESVGLALLVLFVGLAGGVIIEAIHWFKSLFKKRSRARTPKPGAELSGAQASRWLGP